MGGGAGQRVDGLRLEGCSHAVSNVTTELSAWGIVLPVYELVGLLAVGLVGLLLATLQKLTGVASHAGLPAAAPDGVVPPRGMGCMGLQQGQQCTDEPMHVCAGFKGSKHCLETTCLNFNRLRGI